MIPGHPSYPAEPWCVRETTLDLGFLAQSESVFALSNGHLGLRGNLDEGEPRGLSGTYLAGFYEAYPLDYGERGFGWPEAGQSVVPVTEGKLIRLLVEDEPFDVHRGTLHEHERVLDLRAGTLTRRARWSSEYGRSVQVTSRRLVSFRERSVAAISYEVEALGEPTRTTRAAPASSAPRWPASWRSTTACAWSSATRRGAAVSVWPRGWSTSSRPTAR